MPSLYSARAGYEIVASIGVEAIRARMQIAGYAVGNVDVTILAERPKLKDFKSAMRQALADLLHVSVDQVNVKAGTNEGCDAIGRGEAIAAHAVVLMAADAAKP